MTSAPIRDPLSDHLLTPENAAFLFIDYQPSQLAGLERVTQAGAQPVSWVSLACELQRDWGRAETVPAIVDIVLTDRLTKE